MPGLRARAAVLAWLVASLAGGAEPPSPSPMPTPTTTPTPPAPPSPPAGAVAPPVPDGPADGSDRREADAALRAKGLRRSGFVYVLPEEDEVRRLGQELAAVAGQWQAAANGMTARAADADRALGFLNTLVFQRQNLGAVSQAAVSQALARATSGAAGAGKSAGSGTLGETDTTAPARAAEALRLDGEIAQWRTAFDQARFDQGTLAATAQARQAEFRAGQERLAALADGVRRRYNELGADTAVKSALAALNRGAAKPVTLGPREDYASNVRKMAGELIRSKGLELTRRPGGAVLGAVADVRTATYLLEACRRDLAVALGKYQAWRHDAEFRRRRAAELAARGDDPAALARLLQDEARTAADRKKLAADVADRRARYVQSLDVLRKAVEEGRRQSAVAEGSAEVKRALKDLKAKRAGVKDRTATLDDAEKTVRTETLGLVPDRVAVWAQAAVNGRPPRKALLEPGSDAVVVAAEAAPALGVRVDESEPVVELPAPGGAGTRKARRATLESVQLGPFVVRDVPCLVAEKADVPLALGADLLDEFLVALDTDAATLTLTQVDVKPVTARPTPPARGTRR